MTLTDPGPVTGLWRNDWEPWVTKRGFHSWPFRHAGMKRIQR